jgi:hypothetical protein
VLRNPVLDLKVADAESVEYSTPDVWLIIEAILLRMVVFLISLFSFRLLIEFGVLFVIVANGFN